MSFNKAFDNTEKSLIVIENDKNELFQKLDKILHAIAAKQFLVYNYRLYLNIVYRVLVKT